MEFPVLIEIRRSVWLFWGLIFAHLLAAASVAGLTWPWYWRAALLLLVALSINRALRPAEVSQIYLVSKDFAEAKLLSGLRVAINALPQTTVFSFLLVLRLKIEALDEADEGSAADESDHDLESDKHPSVAHPSFDKTLSLVVLRGQMPAEDFRKLSLWLRWHNASDGSDNLQKPGEPTF